MKNDQAKPNQSIACQSNPNQTGRKPICKSRSTLNAAHLLEGGNPSPAKVKFEKGGQGGQSGSVGLLVPREYEEMKGMEGDRAIKGSQGIKGVEVIQGIEGVQGIEGIKEDEG